MKNILTYLFILLSLQASAQLNGYVNDNYSLPIASAKVTFISEQDPSVKYEAVTDLNGYYNITLLSDEAIHEDTKLFQASPNPFYYETAVSFYLKNSCRVKLSIYNMKGQQIHILENATLPEGNFIYTWNGRTANGAKATPGMYLIVLEAGGKQFVEKVILLPSQNLASTGTIHELKSMTVNSYQVKVTAADADTLHLRNILIPESKQLDFSMYRKVEVPFATIGNYLGVWNGTAYDPIFIKGTNLGVSIPGTSPGELAATRDQYARWINMIGEAGFNSIRIYTLHYPRFYQELALYNNAHPEKPIYLFQGVWLEEGTLNGNLYPFAEEFDEGIKEVINCIHGKNSIAERLGKASGKFDADVSRWTIGFIIGREIVPREIEMTDFLNNTSTKYEGTSLKMLSGSPSEVWFAERLDKLITYEKSQYKVHRPVSVSSWPTLDPLDHPSEPNNLEDQFSLDMQNIDMFNASGGYFASYHVYPFYPGFINRGPEYADVKDDEGTNRYLGYLLVLKKHYANCPLIIAEYGVPSSWGIAQVASSGMNHGGLTETQQGEMDVRMLKSIHTAECGGGMLFSWIDEWFKKTWLLIPIQSDPPWRISLWHSMASAEENFGMIAFDLPSPVFQPYQLSGSYTKVSSVNVAADAEYFSMRLQLSNSLTANDSVWIGMDTYKDEVGESILPNGVKTNLRSEFALLVNSDSVKLHVTREYDNYGSWFNNVNPEQVYHSTVTDGKPWNLLRMKNGLADTAFQKTGILKIRKTGSTATSLDAVWFSGNEINIRIPWHYLNFTDPSTRMVLDDDRSTNERETAVSDGIALTISYKSEKAVTNRFVWNTWEQAPATTERVKPGLSIIKNGNMVIGEPVTGKKKKKK